MIQLNAVLEIHQLLIEEFGGKSGIRDQAVLESAIKRPYSGLNEQEFYVTPEEKAAAILESIVAGHPFTDGNKRTGYVLMRLLLLEHGKDILASEEEKYQLVISVASGQNGFKEIVEWIQKHVNYGR